MIITHDFQAPRNLFEKLLRDAGSLEVEINGDNVFNFITTAHFLRDWIKKSPLSESEVSKRFLRRVAKDPNFKVCVDIINHSKPFSITLDENNKHRFIDLGDSKIDVLLFRDEITELYNVYFKMK